MGSLAKSTATVLQIEKAFYRSARDAGFDLLVRAMIDGLCDSLSGTGDHSALAHD